jgi:PAS domain S-box-containing protein
MDTDGSIIVWNTQAEKLFGWTKEEVIGKDLAALVVPESLRDEFKKGVKQYFETGDSPIINIVVEKTALDREHNEFPAEITVAPIQQGDKEFLCLYVRNISDRKNYIAAIENQNARLKEIAWKQSHVVRAPLSRIIGLVDLMKSSCESKDTDELLDYLSASADELDGIVREIVKNTEQIEKPPLN